MAWLAPVWLVAALAAILPVVYHLRRNTPPDVIRVGSVAHLASGAARASRRTPRDILLLVVRSALLVLVAVALAHPLINTGREGRRVVVAPAGEWAVVDSLAESGATVLPASSSRYPWSAAVAAETRSAPDDTLLLVSPNDADRWIGPRPRLARHAIAVDAPGATANAPGPPPHQRAPLVQPAPGTHTSRAGTTLPWWILIGLVAVERLLARRSPDAG